jgi:hypothetical protein
MKIHCAVLALLFLGVSGIDASLFSDDFNSGASVLWGNQSGAWTAGGGVYNAGSGSSIPNARSFLPFSLTDFVVNVDTTTSAGDGGVWLRATDAPVTAVGATGVLLVIRPRFSDIYWHLVTDGSDYGAALNSVGLTQAAHSFQITVSGDLYSVFVDGEGTARTTLTTSAFSGGVTGLYGLVPNGFDNFVLTDASGVPEPATFGLAGLGLGLAALARRRLASRL